MKFLRSQFDEANIKVLAASKVGVHLAVGPDLFRIVFFQGHPEYDSISLLKELKREIAIYLEGGRSGLPTFSNELSFDAMLCNSRGV